MIEDEVVNILEAIKNFIRENPNKQIILNKNNT